MKTKKGLTKRDKARLARRVHRVGGLPVVVALQRIVPMINPTPACNRRLGDGFNPSSRRIEVGREIVEDGLERFEVTAAEVEKLEAVVTSVKDDNGELRVLLERERVEKGELVILAEELMSMQQSFVSPSEISYEH